MWQCIFFTAGTKKKENLWWKSWLRWQDSGLPCICMTEAKGNPTRFLSSVRHLCNSGLEKAKPYVGNYGVNFLYKKFQACLQYFLLLKPRICIYAVLRVCFSCFVSLSCSLFYCRYFTGRQYTVWKTLFFHWQTAHLLMYLWSSISMHMFCF